MLTNKFLLKSWYNDLLKISYSVENKNKIIFDLGVSYLPTEFLSTHIWTPNNLLTLILKRHIGSKNFKIILLQGKKNIGCNQNFTSGIYNPDSSPQWIVFTYLFCPSHINYFTRNQYSKKHFHLWQKVCVVSKTWLNNFELI